MHEFNSFNQILLSLFNVSNVFHDIILVVYIIWYISASMIIEKHV